jgi:hypothetical protein
LCCKFFEGILCIGSFTYFASNINLNLL